jgi:co-chaperonin GroES (HSP10)
MIKCTTTNVIFEWPPEGEKKHGSIYLTQDLSKETGWAKCVAAGPDSVLTAGDELLLSKRVTTMDLNIDGKKLNNTSDASVIAYKHNDELNCTAGTILYEHITKPEEVTESGIILAKKTVTKEFEPVWCKVIACGPKSGVNKGDEILIAYKSDCYTLKIDGKELHNAGAEEVIAYRTP